MNPRPNKIHQGISDKSTRIPRTSNMKIVSREAAAPGHSSHGVVNYMEQHMGSSSTSLPVKDKNTAKPEKKVRFSTVEVREYQMILGDNPGVSRGPSITIDWRPFSRKFFHVETHVRMTPSPRRKPTQMTMPLFHRDFLLKAAGYSRKEILESTKRTNIVKAQRSATVRKLQMSQMEEIGETMKKKIKGTFFRSKKDSVHGFSVLKNIQVQSSAA